MPAALLALLVCLIGAGVLLIIAGVTPTPQPSTSRPPSRFAERVRGVFGRTNRQQRLFFIAGLALGIVLWAVSGWLVYLIGIPIAALAIPLLLDDGGGKDRLERLDALESWTRSLAGLTLTGASLEQTIIASLSSAPAEIRPQVNSLVARLHARWRTRDALEAFADDLQDATADLVVAHLLLAEKMRGPGLAAALDDLASTIYDEVRVRREIASDRAKPRQNARIITITTLGLLLVLPFLGSFMEPYQTVIGQLFLAIWLGMYAAILVWLRRLTQSTPAPRILGRRRAEEVVA